MLDDRALTVNTVSRRINRVPVLKMGRPRVSRWGVIAALQVAEALVVVANSCFWSALLLPSAGNHPRTFELLTFGVAVAMLAHVGLRSRGSYDFVDIMHMWRSFKIAALAWVLSTGPLLCIALLLAPTPTGRTVVLGWLTGLAGIVCVRLAAACASHAFVRARWLNHNVLIIGTGPEAQRCASVIRADGSGANLIGLLSVEGTFRTNHNEGGGAAQMSDLQRSINAHEIKDVIISTSFHEPAQLSDLVKSLLWLPVRVLLWPPSLGVQTGLLAGGGYAIGNTRLLVAGVPPLDGWHWVIKDVRHRVLAILLLIFNLPVLLGSVRP